MAGTSNDEPKLHVLGFDHLVLRVRDVEQSLRFYVDTLGLEGTRVEQYRAGTVPFPSVRITPDTVIDLDGRVEPDGTNVAHFCVEIAEVPLDELAKRGDLEVSGGPVRRWGARGEADLIYIKDPDGNIIELRHYGPTQGFGYHHA
jgi:catechol 2,3-dioxygenase-like lactoylglutathione lyase family enzyme